MRCIWQGDLREVWQSMQLCCIIEHLRHWTLRHFRPWVSSCLDQWCLRHNITGQRGSGEENEEEESEESEEGESEESEDEEDQESEVSEEATKEKGKQKVDKAKSSRASKDVENSEVEDRLLSDSSDKGQSRANCLDIPPSTYHQDILDRSPTAVTSTSSDAEEVGSHSAQPDPSSSSSTVGPRESKLSGRKTPMTPSPTRAPKFLLPESSKSTSAVPIRNKSGGGGKEAADTSSPSSSVLFDKTSSPDPSVEFPIHSYSLISRNETHQRSTDTILGRTPFGAPKKMDQVILK